MAELDEASRVAVWADFMRRMGPEQRTSALTKADIRAAVDAMDTWINNNASAINLAFPVAARNGLTAAEKVGIFTYVASKRYGIEVP